MFTHKAIRKISYLVRTTQMSSLLYCIKRKFVIYTGLLVVLEQSLAVLRAIHRKTNPSSRPDSKHISGFGTNKNGHWFRMAVLAKTSGESLLTALMRQ
jgi:hypothetical protein